MVTISELTDEQAQAERREIQAELEGRVGTSDPATLRENSMLGRYDEDIVRLVRRLAALDFLVAA